MFEQLQFYASKLEAIIILMREIILSLILSIDYLVGSNFVLTIAHIIFPAIFLYIYNFDKILDYFEERRNQKIRLKDQKERGQNGKS